MVINIFIHFLYINFFGRKCFFTKSLFFNYIFSLFYYHFKLLLNELISVENNLFNIKKTFVYVIFLIAIVPGFYAPLYDGISGWTLNNESNRFEESGISCF